MKHKKTISPSAIQKIEAFWRWFNKSRLEIENAVQYHENTEQVLNNFKNKIAQISKYLGFVINGPNKYKNPYFTFIFTVGGQLKKVRLVHAIVDCAPTIPNWKIQALIQPCENLEVIKSGKDNPIIYHDFELKISEMYFDLIDYDIYKKTISIKVLVQNYKYHYDNEYLEETVHIAVVKLLGEVAYSKSISNIQLAQTPNEIDDLIPLYELPEYIVLIKNSNRKLKI